MLDVFIVVNLVISKEIVRLKDSELKKTKTTTTKKDSELKMTGTLTLENLVFVGENK